MAPPLSPDQPGSRQSYAAARLGVPEVMDAISGELIPVRPLLVARGQGDVIAGLRNQVATSLARREPLYKCPLCGSPLRLNSMKVRGRFYFCHTWKSIDCPWHTGTELTRDEIRARQYNGAKESRQHLETKELLRRSLALDPAFAEPAPEQVWKGKFGDWRKPDVSTARAGLKIAFEVQLSTTFLDVIVGRREFYLKEAALLFWIFRSFDLESRRLTLDDVFYPNNRNAFLVGEHTLEESRRQGRFVLECRWLEPVERYGMVVDEWRQAFVGWSDLTIDLPRQRVFHFDYDGARVAIEDRRRAGIRGRFEKFWLGGRRAEGHGFEWVGLRADFATLGIELPSVHFEPDFESLINQLFSAKLGRPVGYSYRKLIQVAHKVYDNYPQNLWWFGQLLMRCHRHEQLEREDTTGKWKGDGRVTGRRGEIRRRMREGDPSLAPDMAYAAAVKFIFPELLDCPDYPILKAPQHPTRASELRRAG